ncbi:NADPH oxidoreductase [Dactylosporangium fulvum]|uniref:Ferredoxin reductase n=1 Tax=Dactylosporangium fulvum TaxID=53359 RepID=A0ABY5WCD3_9ACTN|nr:ferredoxin reductase [Dactylosporangium fulvum]UWP86776.1 ferredoxin reductase [Dactylosporangium fulvum]
MSETNHGQSLGLRLVDALTWLTTPLSPDDYLGLINPLWSSRELRGRVEAVLPETMDAASLVIRPGRGWTGHRAGQYVRVGVDIDGTRHWRSYSLSSPPERLDGCVTVTVKAAREGLVSPYLVRRLTPGAIVHLASAQGGFVLPEVLPPRLLFVTAGSGITPVAGMLRSLAARGEMPDVVLVHSAPTPEDAIFGAELRMLAARFSSLRLYERHTRVGGRHDRGRFTMAQLSDICPDWSERPAWVCGPGEMVDDAERHWWCAGIADRLHVERFRPTMVSGGGTRGRVRFVASGVEIDADGDTPLLAVGENAGVLMPSGCRMGICYSCVTRLRSGRVRDLRSGREHGDEGELIQTCVSAAVGTVEVER